MIRCLSFIFSLLNVLFIGFGLTIIALSIWISGNNNNAIIKNLYQSFFQSFSIMTALFGVLLLLVSILGSMGLQYKSLYIGQPSRIWTSRRIFLFYSVIITLLLGFEIFYIYEAFLAYKEMSNTTTTAIPDDYFGSASLSFGFYESILSDRFNAFYWSATKGCNTKSYELFWYWINNNCKESMNMSNCKKCDDYSVQLCQVDYNTCSLTSLSSTCPYIACRPNIIKFIINNIMPLSYCVLAFAIIQLIAIFTSIGLAIKTKNINQNSRSRNNRTNNINQ